jgi:hypothetical protein
MSISSGMTFLPSFMKICHLAQKLSLRERNRWSHKNGRRPEIRSVGLCYGRLESQLLSFAVYELTGKQYVTRWKVSLGERLQLIHATEYNPAELTSQHTNSCHCEVVCRPVHATNVCVLLVYFPYFEKMKVGLCDHHAVCVSVHPPC